MNTRTQGFVLLLFGTALVRLATSDLLLRFVRPVARPWVLLAGAGILVLAIWTLVADARAHSRARMPGAEHGHDAPHGVDAHGHSGVSRAAWLVVAPVIAILVIAPPSLGAYSANRQPVAVPAPAHQDFAPIAKGADVPLKLIDFATRVVWDDGRTVAGRTVRLTGFVSGATQGGFVITRLVIFCCAADAIPISVGVLSGIRVPATNAWVTVTGTYAGVSPRNATLPLLRASAVRDIAAPANPYDD